MKKILYLLSLTTVISNLVGCKDSTLYVGLSPDFAPYEFLDDSNNIVGFDVDLINEIGTRLNRPIKIVEYEFSGILAALATSSIDLAISGLTINAEREKSVLFSKPYTENAQVLVVKSDNYSFNFENSEMLIEYLKSDKIKIAACVGYVGLDFILDLRNSSLQTMDKSAIYTYNKPALATLALKSNHIEAFIIDREVAALIVKNDSSLQMIDQTLTKEAYAIALNKKDHQLKNKIDEIIDELYASKFLETLVNRWKNL